MPQVIIYLLDNAGKIALLALLPSMETVSYVQNHVQHALNLLPTVTPALKDICCSMDNAWRIALKTLTLETQAAWLATLNVQLVQVHLLIALAALKVNIYSKTNALARAQLPSLKVYVRIDAPMASSIKTHNAWIANLPAKLAQDQLISVLLVLAPNSFIWENALIVAQVELSRMVTHAQNVVNHVLPVLEAQLHVIVVLVDMFLIKGYVYKNAPMDSTKTRLANVLPVAKDVRFVVVHKIASIVLTLN